MTYPDAVMSLHKLSAGDGYLYLMRATARYDEEGPAVPDLGDYYSEKGESPGRWMGRGLQGLAEMGGSLRAGDAVTEAHMKALFGQGCHPEADALYEEAVENGVDPREALRATTLGRRFRDVPADPTGFRQILAIAFEQERRRLGVTGSLEPDQLAAIRDQVARSEFAKELSRDPLDEQELTAFVARKMRPERLPVAGYDLTFSPVKSVSALWSLAPAEIAEEVRQAHRDAVADVLDWLQDEVIYTRRGNLGVRKVETKGVLATGFEHRDARSGDPDLHTHVAIANRVQDASDPDGAWFTIDGTVLHRCTVAASERYNTRLEMILRERLGVEFAPVGREDDLRPVREIVGIDPQLIQAWSSRRSDIERRRAELVAQFQQAHGRVPTPTETVKLAQQATLETRERKHGPRSEQEQREQWREEAEAVLGGAEAVERMIWTAMSPTVAQDRPQLQAQAAAERVIAVMETSRSHWQEPHVRAEAERLARTLQVEPGRARAWVDEVVIAARTSPDIRTYEPTIALHEPQEPAELRRSDGVSVYRTPHATLYTTGAIERAEQRLVDLAGTAGFRRVDPLAVEVVIAEAAANGTPLNPGQVDMVRELSSSGRAVQLVLAPAGSGKTTAMRSVADAWRSAAGTVIALAPAASAAIGLAESMDTTGDTLAKLAGGIRGENPMPAWAETVDARTMIVIDEAGTAGTLELDTAVSWLTQRGASVRLIGDDRQLASVASGGVLRDIAREVGVVSLREVVRFRDRGEAAVSLAVREGDTAAVAWWGDRDRIHAGGIDAQVQDVVAAWAEDQAAGRDAMMLSLSRQDARSLNEAARELRVAGGAVDDRQVVAGRGGVRIGVGDRVIARRNDRRIGITPTHWLKNGDRFTVAGVAHDGSGGLLAKHHGTGRTVQLPADYVASYVDLGYASTIHSAQGMTVDACHVMLTGAEDRQALYVAMSRGRDLNRAYVPVSTDGSEHSVVRPEAIAPETPTEILESIIRRDGAAQSARTARLQAHDATHLAPLHIAAYDDARGVAILSLLDRETLRRIDEGANAIVPEVTECGGWPALRLALAEISLDTEMDALQELQTAVDERELGTARDKASVLWWRLTRNARPGSADRDLGWLQRIPAALHSHPTWGPYLRARLAQIEAETGAIRGQVRHDLAAGAPARWAAGFEHQSELLERVAMWRTLHRVPAEDMRPLGQEPAGGPEARVAHSLLDRIDAARDQGRDGAAGWLERAAARDPRLPHDPYWPVILATLSRAAAAGQDSDAILTAALTRQLPAERCGVALWWRLHEVIGPDVAVDGPTRLLPPWVSVLPATLGELPAHELVAAPDWPTLVSTVNRTAHATGTPAGEVAAELLTRAAAAGHSPDALAAAALLAADLDQAAEDVEELQPPEADTDELSQEDHQWYRDVVLPAAPGHATPPRSDTGTATEPWPVEPTPHETPGPEPIQVDPRVADAIIEANAAAWQYWERAYPGSPAQTYLHGRFGPLEKDIAAGYAGTDRTALLTHLRAAGFDDEILIAADLARYGRHGTLLDTFHDRLMLPIRPSPDRTVAFTGRKLREDTWGPKYLHNASTAAWVKGTAALFGSDQLTDHSIPVLVEGPLDAAAVTAAGSGRFVGIASLGTALTAAQAERLRARPEVAVALDADRAGRAARLTAFRLLTDRHITASSVTLPDGADPAQLLSEHGTAALTAALRDRHPLISDLISAAVDDLDTAQHRRQEACRALGVTPTSTQPDLLDRMHTARTLAALVVGVDPVDWNPLVAELAERLDLLPDTIWSLVTDAAIEHRPALPTDPDTEDLNARARAAIDRLQHRTPGDPEQTRQALQRLAARGRPKPPRRSTDTEPAPTPLQPDERGPRM